MSYLRNCWYLAGWADELPEGGVLARRLLDIPVVLFRDKTGEAKAVLDRCPHRFAPLSMGYLQEGSIVCAYHGLGFGGDGKCTANPHGPIVPALKVEAYPVREAFRGLWIWLGAPELANSAMLPKLGFVDEVPETAFSCGYLRGDGNYQLYADNILDLTHVDFLHPTTLGGGSITRTKPEVSQDGNSVWIQWHPKNERPSPVQYAALEFTSPDQRADSWTEVFWTPPAVMVLVAGAVPAGMPRTGDNVRALHIMTPETKHSTHYFFASTRDFAMDNAEVNRQMAETRKKVFSTEDRPMIVGQCERMEGEDLRDLKPVLLSIDSGVARARRVLQKLIAAEAQASALVHSFAGES